MLESMKDAAARDPRRISSGLPAPDIASLTAPDNSSMDFDPLRNDSAIACMHGLERRSARGPSGAKSRSGSARSSRVKEVPSKELRLASAAPGESIEATLYLKTLHAFVVADCKFACGGFSGRPDLAAGRTRSYSSGATSNSGQMNLFTASPEFLESNVALQHICTTGLGTAFFKRLRRNRR